MMLSQRIKSPAKANLFLYLKGRDHRQYHQLQSLFYILPNLYDLMDFSLEEEPGIKIISNYLIADNLVAKAADLLLQEAGLDKIGLTIKLDKKIPLGGGFGGGSSNAATSLLILNRDLKLGASLEDLIKIADKLGDDVKIFLLEKDLVYFDSPTIRGLEIKLPFKIIHYDSGLQISTKAIYDLAREKKQILRGKKIDSEADIIKHLLEGSNDLYPLAVELEPKLAIIQKELEKQYSWVRMTGSGGGFITSEE